MSNASLFHTFVKAMCNKLGTVVRHYGCREITSGKNGGKLIDQYSACRLSKMDGFRPPGGHVNISEEVLNPLLAVGNGPTRSMATLCIPPLSLA